MKIRKYQGKDRLQIKNLIENVLFEIFKSKPNKLDDLNSINKSYVLFLVAEEDTKIVGTIALANKGKECVIKRLYVNKKYRGKGLAQQLYNRLERFAKAKNVRVLKLSTTPQMKDAIRFYKHNGFVKVGINKNCNQIFFEKKLI